MYAELCRASGVFRTALDKRPYLRVIVVVNGSNVGEFYSDAVQPFSRLVVPYTPSPSKGRQSFTATRHSQLYRFNVPLRRVLRKYL